MSTKLYDIPADIFKDITPFLDDEDLGALYLTTNNAIMSLLRASITRLQYRRDVFADLPTIKTINHVWGDGKSLPPNLNTIATFVQLGDDMSVFPLSLTRLGISCEDGTAILNSIPKTVTHLVIDKLYVDVDICKIPDTVKNIEINDITGKISVIALPAYIECINIKNIQNTVHVNVLPSNSITHISMPFCGVCGGMQSLISLECEYLHNSVQLFTQLERLIVRNCADFTEKQYVVINSLTNLKHLYLKPVPANMIKHIPTSVKHLEINIMDSDTHTISLHEGLEKLQYVSSSSITVNLPSTLTDLMCYSTDIRHLRIASLPNLTALTIYAPKGTNIIDVESYDASIHQKLITLYISNCVDLQMLPNTIRSLTCHSVFSKGILPKHLQRITVTYSCKSSIDNIKSKLKYCSISATKILDNKREIQTLFNFLDISSILTDANVLLAAEEASLIVNSLNPFRIITSLSDTEIYRVLTTIIPSEVLTPDVLDKVNAGLEKARQMLQDQ